MTRTPGQFQQPPRASPERYIRALTTPEPDAPVDASNDRQLFCPECSGWRAHYPIRGGLHKCRRCGREREAK
jgi:hypothetical protein